ncbi:MAG: PEGA domain-containing protein [Methanoregula sp.]|nr:PEGA domain-containing protein [Methanoregula sp.]
MTIILLAALVVIALPAGAVNGTISIGYRGSGEAYIGETIVFDGINTFSGTTLARITGPGLPPEGVPIYNLNGKAGSGNSIPVDSTGSWKFGYYTGTIRGIEKLRTARYTITVFDNTCPDETAEVSVLLKIPAFYVVASSSTAIYGDYVQLTGYAERDVTSVNFIITNEAGNIVNQYDSSVSSSGYFNRGFHVNMEPGVYTITMTSPSVRTTSSNYLVVETVPGQAASPVPAIPGSATIGPGPAVPPVTEPVDTGTGSISVTSSPLGATVFLDSAMMGQTPYELDQVSSGNHLVEIRAPGYQTYSEQVTVRNGDAKNVSTILSKTSASTPLSPCTVLGAMLVSLALILATVRRRIP